MTTRSASAADGVEGLTLTTHVADVPGVRPAEARAMAAMGVRAVAHLIAHVPSRYEEEQPESLVSDLQADVIGSARGEVSDCRVAGFGRRQRFEAVLVDDSGRVNLVWFNAPYLMKKIGAGTRLWVQGKPKHHNGGLQLANPSYRILGVDDQGDGDDAEASISLRPIYPATEGAKSPVIERAVQRVLDDALPLIEEQLPEWARKEHGFPTLADAYRMVHTPRSHEDAELGRKRLAYDELVMLQLGVFLKRAYVRRRHKAPALRHDDALRERILSRLPYELTAAQARVVGEVATDLSGETPANRLIQGDVGSGKTAIAAYALLMAAASGHQGVLLAPTEILAEQHDAGMRKLLKDSDVRIELLTGSLSPAQRSAAVGRIASGKSQIIIGTHALLSEGVSFNSLAVNIIDEQHRFGVHQRGKLRTGTVDTHGSPIETPVDVPHTLVMTATPIPRTLAMTLFGDLDVSTIDELPPGRSPVVTTHLVPRARHVADHMLRERIERGEQAYVVAPVIDGPSRSEDEGGGEGELTAVREITARLESGPLAGRRVAALHGRMARADRERVMERFRQGTIHCLVATTVIEVGVDVPNATLMVIENADRFGLAQLHQLRGRVGRGSKASECVLIADPTTPDGAARIRAMVDTTDGFKLAEKDLEIRGPGELLGSKQSGLPPFRVADLTRDFVLLAEARNDARTWIERSPRLDAPEDEVMRRRLLKRFGDALGLADIS
ncbi:MAG: ATP-dependent DNA helicase RecG [Phycisphaerae bacterium]|nr:ATP-dependent DNA helicase RecG [Phycisphaerae bacterium]